MHLVMPNASLLPDNCVGFCMALLVLIGAMWSLRRIITHFIRQRFDSATRTENHREGLEEQIESGQAYGIANRIAKGHISKAEANRIEAALRERTGTVIIYNCKLAKRRGRNWFDPSVDPPEIHFRTKKSQTGRGVFFEEVQHALDEHTHAAWNAEGHMGGTLRLHAGTFHRLANNTWFELTHDEIMAFLNQAEVWAIRSGRYWTLGEIGIEEPSSLTGVTMPPPRQEGMLP